ncbi:hypothetical protein D3C76_1745720 [compost metagenome]
MVANRPMPVTNEKKQPRAKLRSLRARRSTIGLATCRVRPMNARPARPLIHAVVRMVRSLNQFQRGPSSRVYSRQPRNSARNTMLK